MTNKNGKSKGTSSLESKSGEWKCLCDEDVIGRALTRICFEILERESDISKLALVGIKTCGEILAERMRSKIEEIEGAAPQFGVVDITLYRDDIGMSRNYPVLKGTDLPFEISGARIVLVDDVLFTGRTIRAALDAIVDYGRPKRVELAVLVDRGHRELPIRPDYVGKNIPTKYSDRISVKLKEQGHQDGVYLEEIKS
jgi:pyrimidine operon attenuation protein/uracil phosphoribosyltransferase